jgi:hypothetical protein
LQKGSVLIENKCDVMQGREVVINRLRIHCEGYSFENANVAHAWGLATPFSSFLSTSKSCTYKHGEYLSGIKILIMHKVSVFEDEDTIKVLRMH